MSKWFSDRLDASIGIWFRRTVSKPLPGCDGAALRASLDQALQAEANSTHVRRLVAARGWTDAIEQEAEGIVNAFLNPQEK